MKIQIKYSCPPDAETLVDLFEAINRFGAIDEGFEPEFICGDSSPVEEDACDCRHDCENGECQCGDACQCDDAKDCDTSDDAAEAASSLVDTIEDIVKQMLQSEMRHLYAYIDARIDARLNVENKRTKIKEAKKKISDDQNANISAAASTPPRRSYSLKKQNISR